MPVAMVCRSTNNMITSTNSNACRTRHEKRVKWDVGELGWFALIRWFVLLLTFDEGLVTTSFATSGPLPKILAIVLDETMFSPFGTRFDESPGVDAINQNVGDITGNRTQFLICWRFIYPNLTDSAPYIIISATFRSWHIYDSGG